MLYELGPRAQSVYERLLERIRSGELAPGTRLPAHSRLATSFGVAPLTMRQVLARLEADRVVVREQGRGTFVRAAEVAHVLVVTADPARRSDLERQIRGAGQRALMAATPAEALAALEREAPPWLVVVDLYLPNASDGLRLVRRLRQRLPDQRVAVLNATAGQRTRLEHSLAAPLLIVGAPPLQQLSDALREGLPGSESAPVVSEATGIRLETLLERYQALQLSGERASARELLLNEGVAAGLSVPELYGGVLEPAQYRLGELWQTNQISVAREHLATAVTQAAMVDLAGSARRAPGSGVRVVVACIEGELHDVGARMVADLLELDGFAVRFLGADVPTDSLLAILPEESSRLLVLSAAMPERLVALRAAIAQVRQAYGPRLPIIVGGQIMQWAADAARALDVDLASDDALKTVAAARQLLAANPRTPLTLD